MLATGYQSEAAVMYMNTVRVGKCIIAKTELLQLVVRLCNNAVPRKSGFFQASC